MFRLDEALKVYLHREPIDMRKGRNGLAALVAGGGIKGGTHTKSHNSFGDIYSTIADEVLKAPIGKEFPTAEEKMSELI